MRRIETERLSLVASDPSFADEVASHYVRDREHLEPWSPPMVEELFTVGGQAARLASARERFDTGTAWSWWLVPRADNHRVIGSVSVTQIARGPFCSGMLGYAIEGAYEGRGLMREALTAIIVEAFSTRGMLHRLQANVRPENERSVRLLEALGFQREGLAKDYLFIGGAWRDHVMTALLNPNFEFHPEEADRSKDAHGRSEPKTGADDRT